MNDITFVKGQGNLGRTAPGTDYISGFISYNTGVTAIASTKFLTLIDAVNAGITATAYPLEYKQISEFFRIDPAATLWVMITGATASYVAIATLCAAANGDIKQLGVFDYQTTLTGSTLTTIQGVIAGIDALHMPLSVIYGANTYSITLTNLPNLRALADNKVSVVIGQGLDLAITGTTYSQPAVGATLGAVALAKVSEDIAWVSKFNMTDGINLQTPCFGNGTQVSTVAISTLNQLNTYGYIFLTNIIGTTGTYFNDSHTASPITSDYAYIENNRTIDKAIRGIRTSIIPFLNGPVKIDPKTGYIDYTTIKYLETLAGSPLNLMVSNDEISGYTVFIDPNQNVLSTSQVNIQVTLTIYGVARNIVVSIGF